MASSAISIADKVVTAISSKVDYSNSMSPSVTRKLAPNTDAKSSKDVSSLMVMVTPVGFTVDILSSGEIIEDYSVRVSVRDRIENVDNSDDIDETEISKRLTFVGEMQAQVIAYADDETNDLTMISPFENSPLYDSESLEGGIFYSLTQFTIRNYKEV